MFKSTLSICLLAVVLLAGASHEARATPVAATSYFDVKPGLLIPVHGVCTSPGGLFGGPDSNDVKVEVDAAVTDGEDLGNPPPILADLTLVQAFNVVSGTFGDFTVDISGPTIDWSFTGTVTQAYLTIKADSGFAVYDVHGDTSGTQSTAGA